MDLVRVFILLGLQAVIVAMFAGFAKSRSMINWFTIAMFLPMISWLLLARMSDLREQTQSWRDIDAKPLQ